MKRKIFTVLMDDGKEYVGECDCSVCMKEMEKEERKERWWEDGE